jgi:FAD/FMN-containing dehydrogenase
VDASSFYPKETYRRLRAVRERVDPDGLMRANHEIR